MTAAPHLRCNATMGGTAKCAKQYKKDPAVSLVQCLHSTQNWVCTLQSQPAVATADLYARDAHTDYRLLNHGRLLINAWVQLSFMNPC